MKLSRKAKDTWMGLKVGFQPLGIEQLRSELLGSCLHGYTWFELLH